MPNSTEFQQQLAALKAAQKDRRDARQQAYQSSQQQQRLTRRAQQLRRRQSADAGSDIQQLLREAEQKNLSAWKNAAARQHKERDLLLNLSDWFDPREHIDRCDDHTPILMLPMRIETRFRVEEQQLWVRVFPDDWAVDSFEPTLSDKEVENTQCFWRQYWAAGNRREHQLSAWRNLVASHGEGRAAWCVKNYRPLTSLDQIADKAEGDVVLVITEYQADAADRPAIASYWQNIWKHPNDSAAQAAAEQALVDALGAAKAESVIAAAPFNLGVEPVTGKTREETAVSVDWLELPAVDTDDNKVSSWTEAARTEILPERLVLELQRGENKRSIVGRTIPSAVILGLDPSSPESQLFKQADGSLQPPEELAWLFDFEKAVEIGLGFKVDLSDAEIQQGFDRVLIAGVNLRDDASEAKTAFETLLQHHYYSTTGLSLLPQGAPTNNTEENSDYSYVDDPEKSFDRVFADELTDADLSAQLKLDDDKKKLDGQWFAEWLGLDSDVVRLFGHTYGRDQCEARAINTALWPATIGYTLDTLMAGVLETTAIDDTRQMFQRYVSARGPIPALRIGDQPYGIVATTAWSNMQWLRQNKEDLVGLDRQQRALAQPFLGFANQLFRGDNFLKTFYDITQKANQQWRSLSQGVSHVQSSGDLHQILLDTLGLAPNSLEFYRRNADSLEQIYNLLNLQGLGTALIGWLPIAVHVNSGMALLQHLGYSGDEQPEILKFFFHQNQDPLNDLLIDDRKLSETDPIRAYTDDDRNYIQWLIDAANDSLNTLRTQTGFTDNQRPRAMLYLLLRHALQLSYWDIGITLHTRLENPILDPASLKAARAEPEFLHISQQAQHSESRYFHLFQPAEAITGDSELMLADHIATILPTASEAQHFREMLAALEHLVDTPTARLERLLVEHLDSCTYRLDAWKNALVNLQLDYMRHGLARDDEGDDDNAATARQGIYLGAFGWLENVRPRDSQPQPANVPDNLHQAFDIDARPALDDPQNQGFVHAPSLNQATTAAVLRSTYLSDARDGAADTMAVNLSSWRVRQAIAVMEGMRNEQSLGELLGYRLERDLHDHHQLAETDEFIFALRKHFPLVANRLHETEESLGEDDSIESIEARNVVDGLALAEHIESTENDTYPFGLSHMPGADGNQAQKINAAVDNMRNVRDAVADLAMAESLHHAIQGNVDSAAAVMDAQGSATFPPISEFVNTPREGIALTLRSALFLDAEPPAASPWAGVALSDRAVAAPIINHWLASLLPSPEDIVVSVKRNDSGATTTVSARDLQWQPIDLLYEVRLQDEQRASLLDNRIEARARADFVPLSARIGITVQYVEAVAGKTTFFELAPLLNCIRSLLGNGRPLRPSDIALNVEANKDLDNSLQLDEAKLTTVHTALTQLKNDLESFAAPISNDLLDPEANLASLRGNAATRFSDYNALTERAYYLCLHEADGAAIARWLNRFHSQLHEKLQTLITDWQQRLSDFNGYVARFDALPAAATKSQRVRPLQRAERRISTSVTSPLPNDLNDYRSALLIKAGDFDNKLQQFIAIAATVNNDADTYLALIEAELPLDSFVAEPFTVTDEAQSFVTINQEVELQSLNLIQAIDKRLVAIDAALSENSAASDSVKKVEALQKGFKAAFGEEFVVLPVFTFAEDQRDELTLCHVDADHLLRYQTSDLQEAFPLDNWLHSTARVRNAMAEYEYLTITSETLTGSELSLTAWQLPHQPDDHWVGAEFPADYTLDSDRLLINAHHAAGFDAGKTQAGILFDEWTEVIPNDAMTTGVAFHFDKPNAEAPQSFLLVTPTDFRGQWQWSDVMDALHETLDAAKLRAVSPQDIDKTAYSLFLPATVASTTHYPLLALGLNFAEVNGFSVALQEEGE